MPLLVTEAIVLHAFDYSETSRILRLATREAGVQSVLARGARRSVKRFGSALDLFAQGTAEIYIRDQRELQTLGAFDVTLARPSLADDLDRFAGASALVEMVLRFATDDPHRQLFDSLATALDEIVAADPADAREAALGGAWRLVAELGFAPSLDACSACHGDLPADVPLTFSHVAGGLLCARCASTYPSGRTLPAEATRRVRSWVSHDPAGALDDSSARAHQRLLREFLRHHLAEGRTMRAFDVWERARWAADDAERPAR